MINSEITTQGFSDSELLLNQKWDYVRALRDVRLSSTDIIVIRTQELGGSISEEWKNYRQALRDITTDFDNPDDVIWPIKPT